jgi:transcriptional regulator with XRE-family HTH domain
MSETTTNGFGALLKRHRLAAGITQEGLAERAGISARAVSDLERGGGARRGWRRSRCFPRRWRSLPSCGRTYSRRPDRAPTLAPRPAPPSDYRCHLPP